LGKAHRDVPSRDVAKPLNIWRLAVRIATLAAALLSGTLFSSCTGAGMYGPQPTYGVVPPPDESAVRVTDFSFYPASPIRRGDELTFTLELSRPANAGRVHVTIGERDQVRLYLDDDGSYPDGTAADGIFAGSIVWQYSQPEVVTLPVEAYVYLHDAPALYIDGPPLTVLPDEEGGP